MPLKLAKSLFSGLHLTRKTLSSLKKMELRVVSSHPEVLKFWSSSSLTLQQLTWEFRRHTKSAKFTRQISQRKKPSFLRSCGSTRTSASFLVTKNSVSYQAKFCHTRYNRVSWLSRPISSALSQIGCGISNLAQIRKLNSSFPMNSALPSLSLSTKKNLTAVFLKARLENPKVRLSHLHFSLPRLN